MKRWNDNFHFLTTSTFGYGHWNVRKRYKMAAKAAVILVRHPVKIAGRTGETTAKSVILEVLVIESSNLLVVRT